MKVKYKAVDLLLSQNRVISLLASIALIALGFSGICVFANWAVGSDSFATLFEGLISWTMGITLLSALASMIGSTYVVLGRRAEISDWVMFLTIVWAIPYFGISIFLGGARIAATLRRQTTGR